MRRGLHTGRGEHTQAGELTKVNGERYNRAMQGNNMVLDKVGEDEAFDAEAELRLIDAMPPVSVAETLQAVEAIRQAVKSRGVPVMTMEQIDAEIAQCRKQRRQRQEKRDDLEKVCKLDVQDAFVYQYS